MKQDTPNPEIKFTLNNEPNIEILKISRDGFFYKGERVDDVHNVYERFNEWLTLAEKKDSTPPATDERKK